MAVSLAPEFERLCRLVAADGLARHEAAVAAAVRAAHESGLDHLVLDVLADTGAPTVARERALGRVDGAVLETHHVPPMPAVA